MRRKTANIVSWIFLSSIDATYQEYSGKWLKEEKKKKKSNEVVEAFTEEEGYQMVRPKYLFVE